MEPSALSLFGLVQHLAEIERNWIQRVFARREVPLLYAGQPGGFTLDRSRPFAEEAAVVGGDDEVSLRWVLMHLIEEYARHNGHADLLRERIDGVTGS
ncbi:DUF664 domain-containing protein [Streptomyces sp. NPDC006627]|uniref:mycothiol transferase n=1 Tax=Streptomyces sp. NPDC006627 TaxID=3154679 RepID=UPI00339DCF6C